MSDWLVMDQLPDGWIYEHPVFFANKDTKDAVRDAFRDAGGCNQRDRSLTPLQSGYYDLPHYQQILRKIYAQFPDAPYIVDLGCGDGRFSKLILGLMPDAKIVAVDFNEADLFRLWNALDEGERKRTTLVCASVGDDFPWQGFADAVILSEVAYTLPDPLNAYRSAWCCLKPDGLAMISNVATQAYFVHALLNGDWRQVERILSEKKYVDIVRGQHEHKVEVHLYDRVRMQDDAEMTGFEMIECRALPAEPALLLHGMRMRNELSDDKIELLDMASNHTTDIDRIYISLLRKVV